MSEAPTSTPLSTSTPTAAPTASPPASESPTAGPTQVSHPVSLEFIATFHNGTLNFTSLTSAGWTAFTEEYEEGLVGQSNPTFTPSDVQVLEIVSGLNSSTVRCVLVSIYVQKLDRVIAGDL